MIKPEKVLLDWVASIHRNRHASLSRPLTIASVTRFRAMSTTAMVAEKERQRAASSIPNHWTVCTIQSQRLRSGVYLRNQR